MKLELLEPNYCGTVVVVDKLIPLENCDNLVWFSMFGLTAVVSKDTKVWEVGIFFTTETQLSDEYCKMNNLYRDNTLNNDNTKRGYMENNRRVRAMKFRGNKSNALFMPLVSLNYLWDYPMVWDSFNNINWHEICKKYFVEMMIPKGNKTKWVTKTFKRIDNKTFPEHLDTENYFRNKHKYWDNDMVNITQKLHGSSWRFGYVKVRKQLSRLERLLNKFIKIDEHEYDYIYGSRKVIKNGNIAEWEKEWRYKEDIRKKMLEKYKWQLPKDWIFYWEIIWRAGEKPIQKDYTYRMPKWECELYIYRIAIVNEDWISVDLPMSFVQEYCKVNWLLSVPLLAETLHKYFNSDERLDVKYQDEYANAVKLDKESPCDEWVVVRREWLEIYVTKAKSPMFLEKETKDLDEWIIDTETNELLSSNEEKCYNW